MSVDHYQTLNAPVEFREKVERSEFLGMAFSMFVAASSSASRLT